MVLIKKIYRKIDNIIFKRDKINIGKLIKYQKIYNNRKKTRNKKEINTISVIIPCYNHAQYLPFALNSIMNQTRTPDELILIDDSSKDKTFEILLNYVEKYNKQINIILRKNDANLGQSATINVAVSLASSELVMILNDDDYLMHDAIKHTLRIFNTNHDIYLLGSKSLYIYRQEHFLNMKKETFGSLENDQFLLRKVLPSEINKFVTGSEIDMSHSGSSFLKIAWETVGGYIPKINKRVIMYSDRDFQIRVNSVFPIAIVENAAFAFWRINSSVDAGIFT